MKMKNTWFIGLVIKLSGVIKPLTLSSFLSILSLTVGVATLLVSMALVDSYEKSFKDSIHSIFSHAVIYPDQKYSNPSEGLLEIKKDVRAVYSKEFAISESHKKEGLLAFNGKVAGVILEGVNTKTIGSVVDFKSKVIKGEFILEGSDVSKAPKVIIGKGLYEKFNLSIGTVFSVVIPQADYGQGGSKGFSRKVFTYTVSGVVDLGRHSYNKRFIVMDIAHVNSASSRPLGAFSEVRLRLGDGEEAPLFKRKFLEKFSDKYWVQSWKDRSGGLLEAIKLERWVIFFLVLILVVVAAFNVSTNLYLNLAKRLKEFSVLQTIGMPKAKISQFMIINGLVLGTVGLGCGLVLSLLTMSLCNYLLSSGFFVPPEVYKLTSIKIELSLSKFLVVSVSTFTLCLLASLSPALTVFKLSIVKGLRYE